VLFAFALVHLVGATQRLAGWMTFFGATNPHGGESHRDHFLHQRFVL
jgi:hypothetical protein